MRNGRIFDARAGVFLGGLVVAVAVAVAVGAGAVAVAAAAPPATATPAPALAAAATGTPASPHATGAPVKKKAVRAKSPAAGAARAAPNGGPRPPAGISAQTAAAFVDLALKCVDRPYPFKSERVITGAAAAREPRRDHPVFFGCFDWHSAVHGHWLLVRLARLFPGEPFAVRARAVLDAHLTEAGLRGEAAFFGGADQALFERPYGWAWLLRLAQELRGWDDPDARRWAANLQPLEQSIVDRFRTYLPKLPFPVRTGVHGNTAFALGLALDYARSTGDAGLEQLVVERARAFYGADVAAPIAFEPSGEDFFPPSLLEADLMRRVLRGRAYSDWLDAFLPGLRAGDLGPLARPAEVTDPSDGRIVHLDGLNLVRAWTLRGIAGALPAGDARRKVLEAAAKVHADAGLARVASGHYEGEHWLASFATYLLTVR